MSTRAKRTRASGTSADNGSTKMSPKRFKQVFDAISDNIETVIKGKRDVIRLSLTAIFSEGHILFED
ncbi:MAG: hypothetical protein ABIW46_01970, partial [Acidimicrobiales bacterium]